MSVEGTIPKAPVPGTPVLQEAKMHLVPPTAPGVGVVVSNERCTASNKSAGFIRHLVIDVSKTALAGNFICGQSFGVVPPGVDAHGKPHKLRLYSIASPSFGEDGQGQVLSTTVKRTIDEHHDTGKLFLGVASNFLCDTKPGDEVKVTGPNGKRFALPQELGAHDYLFFATGTGIAPFRGMLMELLRKRVSSKIVLVMGSPYATDLLYHKDLCAWAQEHTNFTYLTALSREKNAEAPAMYCHERVRHSKDAVMPVLESQRGLVYICGIAGMELGVFQRMATELKPSVREQYLGVDDAAMGDVGGWTRRMLHKQVRPTRRVFLEVYD
jgi:ferredoxin--NADP+ reductase